MSTPEEKVRAQVDWFNEHEAWRPEDTAEAIQVLEQWAVDHPEAAATLELRMAAADLWNFPIDNIVCQTEHCEKGNHMICSKCREPAPCDMYGLCQKCFNDPS